MNIEISEDHVYTVDGVVRPSVTQILRDMGFIDYDAVPIDCRNKGLRRGEAVHLACQFIDEEEEGDEIDIPEWLDPYVNAYKHFTTETGFKVLMCETAMYHAEMGYCGMLDRAGVFPSGQQAVLDIKTGAVQDWVRLQTVGYSEMIRPRRYRQRCALELKPTGKYRLHGPWTDIDDFLDWQAIVRAYHRKHRKGRG